MIFKIFTSSPAETKRFGRVLAKKILKDGVRRRALVLGLTGDLGGGKTTFLQGFAKGLGIKERILSPTFIIMRRWGNFYHLDCYRIQKPKELLALGFKEIIADPQNIVAIEWADKVKKIIPKDAVWLNFDFIGPTKRKIVIEWKHGR